jgi:hypothetical protein
MKLESIQPPAPPQLLASLIAVPRSLVLILPLALLTLHCATAPPPEKRGSWKGHKGLVYTVGGDMGLGHNSERGWGRLPAFRAWAELYHRYNLGAFYSVQQTFFRPVPEATQSNLGDSELDFSVHRIAHAIGPVYTIALKNWLDLSLRLGLVFHDFQLMERVSHGGPVCVSYEGGNSCDSTWEKKEDDVTGGYVASFRVVVPYWYWKPGISLNLEYYGGPDFAMDSYDTSSGYALTIMFDLLAFSSEKRPWRYDPWDKPDETEGLHRLSW